MGKRQWCGGGRGGPSATRPPPIRPDWQPGVWRRCSTESQTATRSCPGSLPSCRIAMSSCSGACSVTAGRETAEMRLAVYLPLLLPVLLALLARPISDRLHPRLATWLLTAAAVVLAACAALALMVLAVSAAVRIPLVASLGHISVAVLGPGTAYQAAVG